jgi:hypothetical protein
MTLKIEVTVPDDYVHGKGAADYLASALSAIGYERRSPTLREVASAAHDEGLRVDFGLTKPRTETAVDAATLDPEPEVRASVLDEPAVQAAIAKRERGKPSPGRARRTKEEIAEDEAADRAGHVGAEVMKTIEAADRAMISSGEERINPEDAETVAQDAADEAAETAAAGTGAPTLNDLRKLMGDVQRKHGMATATRIPFLLGKPIAEITDAELPEALAKVQTLLDGDTPAAAQAVTTATVAAGAEPAPTATKEDLVAAMLEYADFADGTREQAKMKWTMVDVPVVFDKLFGVQKLSEVPADGYGKAVAGIREMLDKDPFNRKRG